jgi:ZIP family zinc transporter
MFLQAVALPVYFATGSKWLGFKYAFLSGLAEPAAVVLLGMIFPTNLDKVVVDCLLAAGMICRKLSKIE